MSAEDAVFGRRGADDPGAPGPGCYWLDTTDPDAPVIKRRNEDNTAWVVVSAPAGDGYTTAEVDTLLAGKSDVGHTHDDRYYTEAEIDEQLANFYQGMAIESNGALIGENQFVMNFSTDFLVTPTVGNSASVDVSLTADLSAFSRNVLAGPQLSPQCDPGDGTLITSLASGECGARYLGQAPVQLASVVLYLRAMTAFVPGTGTSWAEWAILSAPSGTSGQLTTLGTADVSAVVNAAGRYDVTITPGTPIPAGTHLYAAYGSQIGSGGVVAQYLGAQADLLGMGVQRFRAATRPSTLAGANAWGTTLVASRNAYLGFRYVPS